MIHDSIAEPSRAIGLTLLKTQTIGEFLKVLRTGSGQKQDMLKPFLEKAASQKFKLSPAIVCAIELGKGVMKPEVFDAMVAAFELTPEERQHAECLYSQSRKGSVSSNHSSLAIVIDRLARIWDRLSPPRQTQLAGKIGYLLDGLEAGAERKVTWAVIPVAGWQAKLTATEAAKLVAPCIDEAVACGITNFLLIRHKRHGELCGCVRSLLKSRKRKELEITDHVQEGVDGLGKAVKGAATDDRLSMQDSFALLLPDDHLHAGCLKELIRLHGNREGCAVALLKPTKGGETYSGFAWGAKEGDAIRLHELREKPKKVVDSNYYFILGRYILDRKVIEALDQVKVNETTKKIELTDALHLVADLPGNHVTGYVYEGKVKSISDRRRQFMAQIDDMYFKRPEN